MTPVPGNTPQERGRNFEVSWARRYGGRPQPGSGNTQAYALDVGSVALLASLKLTDAASIRLESSWIREIDEAITGTRGVGLSTSGLLVLGLDGGDTVVAVQRMETYASLLTADADLFQPSKADERRARAALPSYMRED